MAGPAHALPLAVVIPLVGGALIPAFCHHRPRAAWFLAAVVTSLTFSISVALVLRLVAEGPFGYATGGWPAPYGVELRFDAFSAAIAVFSLISVLVVVFSRRYMTSVASPDRIPLYYALVTINLGGMNGFLVTADLFNLFVFMEVLSVSAYALVAMARGPAAGLAALKYLLLGAVSSLLVLFAVGVLFAQTGTLNMADAGEYLASIDSSRAVALALGALTVGFMVKAALFPLHVWLPDAHASAPGPVSALLSAVVVKAGVVGVIRMLGIFDQSTAPLETLRLLLVWLGATAILAGGFMALIQQDLKRMLAWSTVTNIGYIFLGLGIGSVIAVTGSAVHMANHAVIKAGLFLAAAALVHRTGCRRIDDLRGLGARMPLTALALAVGLLALAGVPPMAGFVGKWQIGLGALDAGHPAMAGVVILGGLLVLAYGVRIINALYFRPAEHGKIRDAREAPASMLGPVLVLAAGSLFLGLVGKVLLDFVTPAVSTLLQKGSP